MPHARSALAAVLLLPLAAVAAQPPSPLGPGTAQPFTYGPWPTRPALYYFRRWAEGRVERQLAEARAFAPRTAGLPGSGGGMAAVAAISAHEARVCGQPSFAGQTWDLHSASGTASGAWHAVLRSKGRSLQYVALWGDRVLAMDPPACSGPPFVPQLASLRRLEDEAAVELPVEDVITGGRDPLLHPKHDQLVLDCVELFHRTANERCKEDFDVKILSATMGIVDGFLVRLHADIVGASGKHAQHRVTCAFELATRKAAAEAVEDVAKKAQLEEEQENLVASVIMTDDICNADQATSVPPEVANAITLAQQYGMGELSLYKGYGHVNEDIPMWEERKLQQAPVPDSYNLITAHPTCFPGTGGRGVVRNQGNCGSCWAFASASSLMTTLCISKEGANSFEGVASRFEVSVQRILSCNPQQLGCSGGYANAAGAAFEAVNISKEVILPYQCAKGNPLNHFAESSTTCHEYPWGGSAEQTCLPQHQMAKWHYLGAWRQVGEAAMARALSKGNALYVTFMVPMSFMTHKKGVFEAAGEYVGGHAVACVGYGVEGGTKYWILQNSWGPTWAENGYCKFKRGINLHSIEKGGVSFLGVTDDGERPRAIGDPIDPVRKRVAGFADQLGELADKMMNWLANMCPALKKVLGREGGMAAEEAPKPARTSTHFNPLLLAILAPLACWLSCCACGAVSLLGKTLRRRWHRKEFSPVEQNPA